MRYPEIARMRGAPTYRQMDHWTTLGLIRSEGEPNPGSGRYREWSPAQVADAIRIKALSDLGLRLTIIQTVMAAERNPYGERLVEVAEGILIRVS